MTNFLSAEENGKENTEKKMVDSPKINIIKYEYLMADLQNYHRVGGGAPESDPNPGRIAPNPLLRFFNVFLKNDSSIWSKKI